MKNIVRVILDHSAQYSDPLVARKGEKLTVGDHDVEWPGWIRCQHANGKSGWVPESFLNIVGSEGTLLCDYNAIELSASAGDELAAEFEESGWLWCSNALGQSGWIPTDHTVQI